MKHDELQLRVYEIYKYNDATDEVGTKNWQDVDKALQALLAVIELHKSDDSDFPDDYENCVECSSNGYLAMYPCQTIKVIEKELG